MKGIVIKTLKKLGKNNLILYRAAQKLERDGWKSTIGKSFSVLKNKVSKNSLFKLTDNGNPNGINLVGFMSSVSGQAVAARSFIELLEGKDYCIFNLENNLAPSMKKKEMVKFEKYYAKFSSYKTNIIFINADGITNLKKHFPALFAKRKNIAVWWWEFDDYFYFPEAFKNIDEVVVMSHFAEKAVKKSAPENVKVNYVTYPFVEDWKILSNSDIVRDKYNIKPQDFLLYFNFDFFSSLERKNPIGLLQAFCEFAKEKDDARLLLKCLNYEHYTREKELMEKYISDNILTDKVVIICDSLDRNSLMTLVNAADCYISLHRSEGLGLGMLEAMWLGKPVIATAYGGNMDFMNKDNSLLVEYTLTGVKHDFAPYKAGWQWAEPKLESAVECMNKLYFDKVFAQNLGKKAMISVKEQFTGDKFREQLNDILDR